MEQYFQREGRDWERYAWQKARPVAGDIEAGERFLEALRPFVYRRYLDYGALDGLRAMKAAIAAEVARKELADDIKRGPGGIREIEFLVQALQLIRGGREPALRERRLLPALQALVAAHLAERGRPATRCATAYRFLRTLENRLQMLRDAQTHALPEDPLDRERIARGLGYADWPALLRRTGRAARTWWPRSSTRCWRRAARSRARCAWPRTGARCRDAGDARRAGRGRVSTMRQSADGIAARFRAPARACAGCRTPRARGWTACCRRCCTAAASSARTDAALRRLLALLHTILRRSELPGAARRAARRAGAAGRRGRAQRAAGRAPGRVSAAAGRTAGCARGRARCPSATALLARVRRRWIRTSDGTIPKPRCRRSTSAPGAGASASRWPLRDGRQPARRQRAAAGLAGRRRGAARAGAGRARGRGRARPRAGRTLRGDRLRQPGRRGAGLRFRPGPGVPVRRAGRSACPTARGRWKHRAGSRGWRRSWSRCWAPSTGAGRLYEVDVRLRPGRRQGPAGVAAWPASAITSASARGPGSTRRWCARAASAGDASLCAEFERVRDATLSHARAMPPRCGDDVVQMRARMRAELDRSDAAASTSSRAKAAWSTWSSCCRRWCWTRLARMPDLLVPRATPVLIEAVAQAGVARARRRGAPARGACHAAGARLGMHAGPAVKARYRWTRPLRGGPRRRSARSHGGMGWRFRSYGQPRLTHRSAPRPALAPRPRRARFRAAASPASRRRASSSRRTRPVPSRLSRKRRGRPCSGLRSGDEHRRVGRAGFRQHVDRVGGADDAVGPGQQAGVGVGAVGSMPRPDHAGRCPEALAQVRSWRSAGVRRDAVASTLPPSRATAASDARQRPGPACALSKRAVRGWARPAAARCAAAGSAPSAANSRAPPPATGRPPDCRLPSRVTTLSPGRPSCSGATTRSQCRGVDARVEDLHRAGARGAQQPRGQRRAERPQPIASARRPRQRCGEVLAEGMRVARQPAWCQPVPRRPRLQGPRAGLHAQGPCQRLGLAHVAGVAVGECPGRKARGVACVCSIRSGGVVCCSARKTIHWPISTAGPAPPVAPPDQGDLHAQAAARRLRSTSSSAPPAPTTNFGGEVSDDTLRQLYDLAEVGPDQRQHVAGAVRVREVGRGQGQARAGAGRGQPRQDHGRAGDGDRRP